MCKARVGVASDIKIHFGTVLTRLFGDTVEGNGSCVIVVFDTTRQDSGVRWSRVLGFAVGVSGAVRPIDLFLGAEDDYRQWLLLELFMFGGLEPVRVTRGADESLHAAVSSARLLAECDLTEFWTSCCQGTLSLDGVNTSETTVSDFVLRTVNLAQELSVSAVDGRFSGLLTTLFPDVGPSRQRSSLAHDLILRLDADVIHPAQRVLLSSTDNESGALHNASAVLYSLLPRLPPARAWKLTLACIEKICSAGTNETPGTLQSAATVLIAGHGLATVATCSCSPILWLITEPSEEAQFQDRDELQNWSTVLKAPATVTLRTSMKVRNQASCRPMLQRMHSNTARTGTSNSFGHCPRGHVNSNG